MPKNKQVRPLAPEGGDANSEATTMLVGYQGAASRAGRVRLYPISGDYSQYLEFDESAIVQAEKIPESVLPNGGYYVWIRLGSPVSWTREYPTVSRLVADIGRKTFGVRPADENPHRIQ
jgi:hypothetical protein